MEKRNLDHVLKIKTFVVNCNVFFFLLSFKICKIGSRYVRGYTSDFWIMLQCRNIVILSFANLVILHLKTNKGYRKRKKNEVTNLGVARLSPYL